MEEIKIEKEKPSRKPAVYCALSYFILSFFGSLAIQIIILLVEIFVNLNSPSGIVNDNLNQFYSATINCAVYVMIICPILIFGFNYLKDDSKTIKKNIGYYILAIFLIYFALIITNAISLSLYEMMGIDGTSENQSSLNDMILSSGGGFLLTIIAASIIGPIVEEMIFRKCLFEIVGIDWLSIIVSGLAFGLIHVVSGGDYIQSIPYILSGLVFAIAYKLCNKNIYPLIVAHMLINTISILGIYFLN